MSEVIPEGWQIKSIADIGEVITGFTPDTKNETFWGEDTPFISPADFNGNVYIKKTSRKLSLLGSTQGRLIPENSVLVTCIGSIGGIAMSSTVAATNQQINAVVTNCGEDSRYFFYNVLFNISELTKSAGTTTIPIINKKTFSQISLGCPPLPEQQKIATILSSVDDVIEKTRVQIDKLKDLKTGMMQELLTQGIGHTEFKDSPVGRIPEGWRLERISTLCTDIVDCVNKTAPTVEYVTPYRMIRTTNVRDGIIETDNMRYVTEETYIAWSRRICLEVGDLVFTREAPMGECGLIQDPKGLFLGQRTMLYRVDPEKLDNGFLLCSMQSDYVQSQIQDLGGGSTTPHLRVPDCGKILLKIPPVHEQRNISASIKTVVKHIEAQQKKLQQALALKKALMQDLLTGKVRVKLDQPETTAA